MTPNSQPTPYQAATRIVAGSTPGERARYARACSVEPSRSGSLPGRKKGNSFQNSQPSDGNRPRALWTCHCRQIHGRNALGRWAARRASCRIRCAAPALLLKNAVAAGSLFTVSRVFRSCLKGGIPQCSSRVWFSVWQQAMALKTLLWQSCPYGINWGTFLERVHSREST